MNTRSPFIMTTALVLSVLIHLLLLYTLADVSMGRIDGDLLSASREVVMVERSPDDLVLQEDEVAFDPDEGSEPMQQAAPDLSEMSMALLQDQVPPPESFGLQESEDNKPALREVDMERDLEQPPQMPVDLPDLLADQMLGPAPDSLTFISGDIEPDLGSGMGLDGNGVGDTAQARSMLHEAGLLPGVTTLPPTRPHVVEAGPSDQRILEPNIARPNIDFARLAVDETTQLDIPEHLDGDFDYKLTVYRDAQSRQPMPNYFRVDISAKRSLSKLPTMPKDVVYLLDISGSVDQAWVGQMVQGVWDSLALMNEHDRYNIVLFNDQAAALSSEGPLPANDESLAKASRFLSNIRSQGYTDVNRALSKMLVRDIDRERVYNIILISDGKPTRGVMDTREIINLITRDNDLNASIYCVGVGLGQDRSLLNFLAYRNRGFSVFVDNSIHTAGTIRDLMSRLRYPIMKDVKVATVGLDDGSEVYPRFLPNIHQGETFQVFGTFNHAGPFTMRIAGHNGRKALDLTRNFNLKDAQQGEWQVAVDWAFWKLHHLYSRIIAEGELKALVDQIRAIEKRYKLKTLY